MAEAQYPVNVLPDEEPVAAPGQEPGGCGARESTRQPTSGKAKARTAGGFRGDARVSLFFRVLTLSGIFGP